MGECWGAKDGENHSHEVGELEAREDAWQGNEDMTETD